MDDRLRAAIQRLATVIAERAEGSMNLRNAIIACAEVDGDFLLNGLVDGIVEETNKIRAAIEMETKRRSL